MVQPAPLGELEHKLLWVVLRLGLDAYGVAILKEFRERAARSISRGTVYVTLDRLVRKGYLSPSMGAPSSRRGGRAKRFFAVTPAGCAALGESRRTFLRLWGGLEGTVEVSS